MLADETGYETAENLIGEIIKLTPTEEDTREVRDALLRLFDRDSDVVVVGLASEISRLATTNKEKDQALGVMLNSLIDSPGGWIAKELIDGAVELAATAENQRLARTIFLKLLTGVTGPVYCQMAATLARSTVRLAMTEDDKRQVRESLLAVLTERVDEWATMSLISAVVELAVTTEDQRQVRSTLFKLLAGRVDDYLAAEMVRGTVELAIEEDEQQVREALLRLITDQITARKAATLTDGVIQLHPTAEEMRRCRVILLGMLTTETHTRAATALADTIARLEPTVDDRCQARRALNARGFRRLDPDGRFRFR